MDIDTEKLVEQLGRGWGTLRGWLQEYFSEQEAMAYSEGIKIGIEKTISALYEADVDDTKIVNLLNKYWGIPMEESEQRLLFEKRRSPMREIQHFLKMQGLTSEEIRRFIIHNRVPMKLKDNPELGQLRHTPGKLVEAVKNADI